MELATAKISKLMKEIGKLNSYQYTTKINKRRYGLIHQF